MPLKAEWRQSACVRQLACPARQCWGVRAHDSGQMHGVRGGAGLDAPAAGGAVYRVVHSCSCSHGSGNAFVHAGPDGTESDDQRPRPGKYGRRRTERSARSRRFGRRAWRHRRGRRADGRDGSSDGSYRRRTRRRDHPQAKAPPGSLSFSKNACRGHNAGRCLPQCDRHLRRLRCRCRLRLLCPVRALRAR